jgi:hypothetical protein
MAKYYKVTDLDENIFSLVEKGSDKITVTERNKARGVVSEREIEDFNVASFGGKVTEITGAEFNQAVAQWTGVEASADQDDSQDDTQNDGSEATTGDADATTGDAEATSKEAVTVTGVDPAAEGADVTVNPAAGVETSGDAAEGTPAAEPAKEETAA